MVRKTKKGKKKAKKLTPEEEKEALVETLMVKCNMSKDEILKLYDDFYEENPEGVISRDKYVASMKVLFIINASLIEYTIHRIQ